jgi:hypothetical protein
LFGVVEFGGAARFFPEDVIDVFERLFEHIVNLEVLSKYLRGRNLSLWDSAH